MRLYLATAPIPPVSRGQARTTASAAAYGLLPMLLEAADLPTDAAYAKTAEGRPFLPACPQADFSISHTDTLALCLLAVDSQRPPRVGIDAEPLLSLSLPKVQRLAARFLTPGEQAYVNESNDTVKAFLEMFTGKEAFAKYVGTGLAKTLKIDTVCPHFAKIHHAKLHRLLYREHVVSLCLPEDVPSGALQILKHT